MCGGGGEYRGILHRRWLGSDQDGRAKLDCPRSLAGLETLEVDWECDESLLVGCGGQVDVVQQAADPRSGEVHPGRVQWEWYGEVSRGIPLSLSLGQQTTEYGRGQHRGRQDALRGEREWVGG